MEDYCALKPLAGELGERSITYSTRMSYMWFSDGGRLHWARRPPTRDSASRGHISSEAPYRRNKQRLILGKISH